METLVYPDALRGIVALLREFDVYPVRPELIVPTDYYNHEGPTVVHVQQINSTEGTVDRVQEVRLTAYGHQPLQSQDIIEAILAYITGDGIYTPAIPDLTDAFYFDSIRQRLGPSMLDWPTDQVFPASATVDARARPMNT